MYIKTDTIIFISNPFGFGPTSRVVILIEELVKRWRGKIIYAASAKCQEIFADGLKKRVKIVVLDERNGKQLKKLFLEYPKSLVVVSLNKIAVKTAKKLGMKVLFIDSLAWMWKTVPKEYLLADTYYYYDIFDARKKMAGIKNAKPIPPILGILPFKKNTKNKTIVIHIGGFCNPFMQKSPQDYLQILANVLQKCNQEKKIIVAGGKSAVQFLAKKTGKIKNVLFKTLNRKKFVQEIIKAERLITTPGITTTLEAFALNIPTAFLLPTNLSQWKQLKLFTAMGAAPLRIEWEEFIKLKNFNKMTEKEAITEFELLSKKLLNDLALQAIVVKKIKSLMTTPFNTNSQKNFIRSIGWKGASVIISDILKLLTPTGN